MPPEWEDDFWHENSANNGSPFEGKSNKKTGVTLRPPLYNGDDYTVAILQLFSSHPYNSPRKSKPSVLIEHSSPGFSGKEQGSHRDFADTPPEMSMRKFLNGSELLFKLEADLRHAYPTFVQEFVSGHCEGVSALLEALKTIQTAINEVTGLREQRKLFMDEQKCLHCLRLCLRNIEAVSKMASYPGGLYPLAASMIGTVSSARIIALEILTCVCTEGGPDGHFKVSEAISTLRLRMGEPIRCKILIGAISSAPPGTFQAKGIRFLTAWVASAVSPKHKVHIQCELEEAGFNPSSLRKGAELGGAREAREVHTELDAWDRCSIDVDTLTRQNCQLRNSVATLQQELATLKDKIKRMDVPQKMEEPIRKRSSRPMRAEDLVTTPADSEEEAEQIHQILEDLNNIVNSEMNNQGNGKKPGVSSKMRKEKEIVPIHLVKSPPKSNNVSPMAKSIPRPWPGSSASDDDDSDIVDREKQNVRRVVEHIESLEKRGPSPKLFVKNSKSKSQSQSPVEPKPDYPIPNFHKQNHMASKFANFKSSKLYASSPDNSIKEMSRSPTFPEKPNGKVQNHRYSPNLEKSVKKSSAGNSNNGLRRSESLHASLASIITSSDKPSDTSSKFGFKQTKSELGKRNSIDKWKSMDNLDGENDNFTLRWRYPQPPQLSPNIKSTPSSSPKSGKNQKPNGKTPAKKMPVSNVSATGGTFEICNDYRQSRFTKNGKQSSASGNSNNSGNSTLNIFSRYSKKAFSQQPPQNPTVASTDKENLKMFSLPPIFVSQGIDHTNHRICDLPSGLY